DRLQWWTRICRAPCRSTYYPRLAPYCQSSWGYTQPCWRRVADNYNCPRPDYHATTPPPPTPRPFAPAAEPEAPQSPSLPPTSSLPHSNKIITTHGSGAGPTSNPLPEKQAPRIQPEPTRFTSVADTQDPEPEADEDEGEMEQAEVEDTLESRVESSGSDMEEDDEESDPPAIDE
ncbi:MAG TPA: hypothetical protein VKU82_13225, partial [Planctomycetaceae bacterium]|nr:hypothetical protein [Planctomycetaceae bacterium]